jgi:hypothetical protein
VVFGEGEPGDHIVKVEKRASAVATPGSGAAASLGDYAIESAGRNELGIRIFHPGEYVLTNQAGRRARVLVERLPDPPVLDIPWTIRFPDGWGAPDMIRTDELFSWPESPVDGIKYFSGTAVYSTEFRVPDYMLEENHSLYLDLGRVNEIAEVRLNGESVGVLWKPPYRLDITKSLALGLNRLEIAVTNLWNNRIVGDLRAGKKDGYTRTNLKAKFDKENPLLPSGLLGPVFLRPAVTVDIEFDR